MLGFDVHAGRPYPPKSPDALRAGKLRADFGEILFDEEIA
jgi:hypothetical protein